MTTETKVTLTNVFIHFGVLGLVVKPLYFPSLPNDSWIILIGMIFIVNPIVAYFYDWDMNFGAACVSANEPKRDRLIVLVILVSVYIAALLAWMGVIGHWYG